MGSPTTLIDTTFSAKDISTAISVYEYTAGGDYTIRIQVRLAAVAGNGDYVIWATLNDGDAQTDDRVGEKTTVTLDSGETAAWFATIPIDVKNGDVVNIFILGQAGDTSEAGSVRIFSDNYSVAGDAMTLADDAITAGKFDESTAFPTKSADSGATQIARVGADGDSLETLSDQLDLQATLANQTSIKTKTDQLTFTTPNKVDATAEGDIVVNATVAISSTEAASVASGELAIKSFNTVSQAIESTVTDDLDSLTKLWLAVKSSQNDSDAEALLFIEETDGLMILDGDDYTTPAHGSLVVSGSSGDWAITIFIDEVATGLLHDLNGTYFAELKGLSSGDTLPLWDGHAIVTKGVIRAVV